MGAVLALASLSEFAAQVVVSKSLDAVSGKGAASGASAGDGSVVVLISLAVSASALEWLFNYLRYFLSSKVVGDTIFRLRSEAFSKSVAHDLSFYDEHSSGKVVSRITTDTEDFANVIGLVVDFLSQIVLVDRVPRLSHLAQPETHPPARRDGARGDSRGPGLQAHRPLRDQQRQAGHGRRSTRAIQESVAGIGVAKGFRRERSLWGWFKTENALAYRFGLRRGVVLQLIFPVVCIAAGVGNGIIVFAGGMAARGGALTMGAVVHLHAGRRFLLVAHAQHRLLLEPASGRPRRRRARLLPHRSREPRSADRGFRPRADRGRDRVQGASASPTRSKETVLGGLFARRSPRARSSRSSAGLGRASPPSPSSSAASYEFQSGELLVDGRDIRGYSLDALRGAIGLVSQDPFLFPGTVADNIRYGLPGAPDSRIEEAARSLGRGDWVDDLPSGLATETGHRGSSLSMGQRQLVVLARVLLRDPRVFILDEATSSVDPFTEAQIQEGLEAVMSGRTAIVIAHRLSTVRSADRIVVLDKGRILEEGSHEGLLDRGGNYAELYRSYFRHQSLEYIETAPAAAGA